jgi:hypothetical protein
VATLAHRFQIVGITEQVPITAMWLVMMNDFRSADFLMDQQAIRTQRLAPKLRFAKATPNRLLVPNSPRLAARIMLLITLPLGTGTLGAKRRWSDWHLQKGPLE